MSVIPGRRDFVKQLAVLGALSVTGSPLLQAAGTGKNKEGDGTLFLFQGDSITDGNRTRNNDWNHVMGHGYQYIIASKLWYDHPQKGFRFLNRGISGNKITDLAARWQQDTLDLKPDVLSILIGINDTSALLSGNKDFGTAQYESGYRSLLEQTTARLPGVQLVLCEPFVLPVGRVKDKWDEYKNEVDQRRTIVQKLSVEYKAVLVSFQAAFDKALLKAPAEYWIWDGIHPMPAGHELMAREWLRQVGKKLKFIR